MKILVTGGAGFTGWKFAEYVSKSNEVHIIDFEEKITDEMKN